MPHLQLQLLTGIVAAQLNPERLNKWRNKGMKRLYRAIHRMFQEGKKKHKVLTYTPPAPGEPPESGWTVHKQQCQYWLQGEPRLVRQDTFGDDWGS